MTMEYILLLVSVSLVLVKVVAFGPKDAFKQAGPKLAARVESQLATGTGFKPKGKNVDSWQVRESGN